MTAGCLVARRAWRGLGLVVPLVVMWSVATTTSAEACSQAGATYALVGVAVAKDDGVVAFRVEEVIPGEGTDPRLELEEPAIGSEVRVEYGGDARYLHVGERYQASVWGDDGVPHSGVATAEEDCGGGGTRLANGDSIETGLFTRNGFEPWVLVPVLGVFGLVSYVGYRIVSARLEARRLRSLERSLEASDGAGLPGVIHDR